MATIQLKNSADVVGGVAKPPTSLALGELAINTATGHESLFLKNSGNTIVKLPINYLKGVSSDVQTQLNGKSNTNHTHNYLDVNGTAIAANKLTASDNRNTATTPDYYNSGVYGEFKYNNIAGLSDGGNYTGLLTFRKYGSGTDFSGGKSGQLAFTDNSNIWCRFGTNSTWENWRKIYHSGNINNDRTDWICNTLSVNDISSSALSVNNQGDMSINAGEYDQNKYNNSITFANDGISITTGKMYSAEGSASIKLTEDNLILMNGNPEIYGSMWIGGYTYFSESVDIEGNMSVGCMFSVGEDMTVGGEVFAMFGNFTELYCANALTCNDIVYSKGLEAQGDIKSTGDIIAHATDMLSAKTLEYTEEESTENSPTALDIVIEQNNKLTKQVEYLLSEIQQLKQNLK